MRFWLTAGGAVFPFVIAVFPAGTEGCPAENPGFVFFAGPAGLVKVGLAAVFCSGSAAGCCQSGFA